VSAAQVIVVIVAVGLLGLLHLALRTARVPAGIPSTAEPRPWIRRDPVLGLLVLAALAALAFAGLAFIVSLVDDEDTTGPPTQATTTAPTTTTATTAPPPPQPPPPAPAALEPPAGAALVARVITNADGSVADSRNRVGNAPIAVKQENGVYAVDVPGLSPTLRRQAILRVRSAGATRGVSVSARKMGPEAEFVVFTRNARTGEFAYAGFVFAAYLPKEDLEATAGDDEEGRPALPGTR
jgi:uncharacterized iron-regulated membrane protein